jgi:hypothetical protein
LIGSGILFFATTLGIGISPDSTYYLDGAKNIIQGHGYSIRLVDLINPKPVEDYIREITAEGKPGLRRAMTFPPFYSIVLSAMIAVGMDGPAASRILNLILFGLNVFLIGLMVSRITARSRFFVLGAILAALFSESLLDSHTMAISEPLFMFLGNVGLVCLASHLEKPSSRRLGAAAVLVGLAFLTRYIGGALIVTGILVLLLDRKPFRKRLTSSLWFGTISLLPMAGFLIYNILRTGEILNRQVTSLPLDPGYLQKFLGTLSSWIFPSIHRVATAAWAKTAINTASIIIGAASLWLAIRLVRILRQEARSLSANRAIPAIVLTFLIYIPTSLGLFLLARMFVDEEIPLDIRILSPIFGPWLVVAAYFIREARARLIRPGRRRAVAVFLTAYLVAYSVSGLVWIAACHGRGRGFNGREWRGPGFQQAYAAILGVPSSWPIFTNDAAAIYLHTSRSAYESFGLHFVPLDKLLSILDGRPALFVYFKTRNHIEKDPTFIGKPVEDFEKELSAHPALEMIVQNTAASVLRTIPPALSSLSGRAKFE